MEGLSKIFSALYEHQADAIFRHLFLRLGDRERAKELTQEVFMRSWQYLAAGKQIEHEKAFLYKIANNLFINEIRTDKRTYSLDELSEVGGYEITDEQADSSLTAHQRELMTYLHTLKESYREVLVMRYIDGLQVKDIAEVLEEKDTNITMRIQRALEKLRHAYELNNKKK
jgi:RNA polymerase sigma-70 factor (ECF subfamily)